MIQRQIPSTGELLPVVGLGTWQNFDVSNDAPKDTLTDVLTAMQTMGAKLIDSSPMYGRSEAVAGELTQASGKADDFFYATKVWTTEKAEGIRQMDASFEKLKRSTIDLMQVHNLVDWKTHLGTLNDWKAAGKIKYIGITHYTDDMHEELERIISTVPVDFVQFNYSIFSRHAEERLLPAAKAHGVATLINRPLDVGKVFEKVKTSSLPEWCKEYDINTWAQFFLKYIISEPAVTCIIPATTNPVHMKDNLAAGEGRLPDEQARNKMVTFIQSL